jgi:hypothetical protein
LGLIVSGKVAPETVNPLPLAAAALTVTAALPVDDSVTVSVAAVFTETLPNATLVALTPSVAAYAPSDKAKLSELFEVDAVSVAVCAVLTAVTVAEKLALLAPDAITTEAGTVTAALLLARFTLMPPDGAVPLTLTVHVSVPAPVKELEAQVSEDNSGRITIVPVPLSATARVWLAVALLAIVSVPDKAPLVVGSNCTVTVAV